MMKDKIITQEDVIDYKNEIVECLSCENQYNPSSDSITTEVLSIPPIIANLFCSRKCYNNYQSHTQRK